MYCIILDLIKDQEKEKSHKKDIIGTIDNSGQCSMDQIIAWCQSSISWF